MISKIKEALICLRAGRVTFRYPLEPMPAPKRFRGRPTIDGSKCLGCGACAAVCPPRLILMHDQEGRRTVELNYSRCTYCARCQEICPVGAMTCTEDFELATNNRGNFSVAVELETVPCRDCSTPFMTQRMLKKMIDEFRPPWMEKMLQTPEWFWLCPDCRLNSTGLNMERNIKNE
jgi:hydrogenase-4 component H